MEKVSFTAIVFTLQFLISCDKPKPAIVPDKVMQEVYEEIKTPYKYGLVMVPPDDSKKMDCPSVFRKGFACSYDLVHWTDWTGDDLIAPSEPYDERFAHKSFVIKHKGVVYHFYCAVNKKDQRGIAVATSEYLGKSEMDFAK